MNDLRAWILLHTVILQALLQVLFNLEGQTVLKQSRDLLAVVPVAVTNGEEVAVAQVEHVRVGQVGVLVHFVRVVSCDASLRREGKLGDDVVDRIRVPRRPLFRR